MPSCHQCIVKVLAEACTLLYNWNAVAGIQDTESAVTDNLVQHAETEGLGIRWKDVVRTAALSALFAHLEELLCCVDVQCTRGQKEDDAEHECAVCLHLSSSVLLCLTVQAYRQVANCVEPSMARPQGSLPSCPIGTHIWGPMS